MTKSFWSFCEVHARATKSPSIIINLCMTIMAKSSGNSSGMVKVEPQETTSTPPVPQPNENDEKKHDNVGEVHARNNKHTTLRIVTNTASAASSAVSSTFNNTTTAPDVEIERENSAWDALGERFEDAASKGRYIDLTDAQEGGTQLSPSRAQSDFSSKPAPVDPSSIVQQQHPLFPMNENSALAPLWNYISNIIGYLRTARESLMRAANGGGGSDAETMIPSLHEINRSMYKIQTFVNKHSPLVADSPRAQQRVEELNLLVYKANVFIQKINSQQENIKDGVVNRPTKRRRR